MEIERSSITVLVIDDEPDILELLEEEFQDAGYRTLRAASGNEAVDILDSLPVDVVVSDFKMPNGNGMTVLNRVQEINEEKRPSFFFVSGQADVSVEDCLEAGARRFFNKPFDIDELIGEVEIELTERGKDGRS